MVLVQKLKGGWPRANKFNARPTTVENQRFDSKAEADRFIQLRLLQRSGHIRDLECQPVWELKINGEKIGRFTADFKYIECGPGKREELVVEDVKSPVTARLEAYRLRTKVWKALYPGITFREVGKS